MDFDAVVPVGDRGDAVRAMLKTHDVDTVVVGGCDINGAFRGKRLRAKQFDADPAAPVRFADYMMITDPRHIPIPKPTGFTGWWPDWSSGFGDIQAVPDLTSFRVVPWLDRTALVLCDYQFLDGTPLPYSPRQVLKRVTDLARERGFVGVMGPELEFFLIKDDPVNPHARTSADLSTLWGSTSIYGVFRGSLDETILRPLRDGLVRFGVDVGNCHVEGGLGQYEINLNHTDPLAAADQAFLLKHAVREIAARHGLLATFMSKPFADGFGSSFHVHQSLWSVDGRNVFHDPAADDSFSDTARHYIAGELSTLADFTSLYAPTVNSYKRLVPHSASGTTRTWGPQNRTAAVRTIPGDESSCQIELRTPGADANPYLVMAAALAGGLHGIDKAVQPAPATTGDAYRDSHETIPRTLGEASDRLLTSDAAEAYLGADFVPYYVATRRWEVDQFAVAVTDWEVSRYLNPM